MQSFQHLPVRVLFGGLLVIILTAQPASAHPFHSSSAEMEWNPESRSFEIGWKVNADDLQRALRLHSGKRIVLEKLNKQTESIVFDYVRYVFTCRHQDKPLKIQPVGVELDRRDMWIFFELPMPKGVSEFTIRNEMLLAAPQQTNHWLVKVDEQKLSLTFDQERTVCKFSWEGATLTSQPVTKPD